MHMSEMSMLRSTFLAAWCVRYPHLTWEDFHELKKLAPHGSDLEHTLLAREIGLFLQAHPLCVSTTHTIAQSG
jgi:hypothetical protein